MTAEASDEFLRVMVENWESICDNVKLLHHGFRITRKHLNTMREPQGLPPVRGTNTGTHAATRPCGGPSRRRASTRINRQCILNMDQLSPRPSNPWLQFPVL